MKIDICGKIGQGELRQQGERFDIIWFQLHFQQFLGPTYKQFFLFRVQGDGMILQALFLCRSSTDWLFRVGDEGEDCGCRIVEEVPIDQFLEEMFFKGFAPDGSD